MVELNCFKLNHALKLTVYMSSYRRLRSYEAPRDLTCTKLSNESGIFLLLICKSTKQDLSGEDLYGPRNHRWRRLMAKGCEDMSRCAKLMTFAGPPRTAHKSISNPRQSWWQHTGYHSSAQVVSRHYNEGSLFR